MGALGERRFSSGAGMALGLGASSLGLKVQHVFNKRLQDLSFGGYCLGVLRKGRRRIVDNLPHAGSFTFPF